MNFTPADVLVVLWSCLTSFWLLLYRNPAQAFYFKYCKAPDVAVTKEGCADGSLEFELKDFTHDVHRRLEVTTSKGVGRLSYHTGRQVIASIAEESDPGFRSGNVPDPSAGGDMSESTSPNVNIDEGTRSAQRSPQRRPRTARHNRPLVSPSSQQLGESPNENGVSSI
ncbi:hypothetical protein BKA70DRAFT_1442358 [Coprinopsis sp. MPI-PUGE-AT-0042]|nr:hypothetical protein BKA70DRAFT_1442358 [Coprinopsis sp. MPI-PUGE-AT-0042]